MQNPGPVKALEVVSRALLEAEHAIRGQGTGGGGHEDLPRGCGRSDPGRLVHRDSPDIVAHHLDLAGVDPGSDLQIEGAGPIPYRPCGMDRPGRPIEYGQEAVPVVATSRPRNRSS